MTPFSSSLLSPDQLGTWIVTSPKGKALGCGGLRLVPSCTGAGAGATNLGDAGASSVRAAAEGVRPKHNFLRGAQTPDLSHVCLEKGISLSELDG